MSSALKVVVPDSFTKDVLQSDLPVVVNYWSPISGPCKALAPSVEKLAQEYSGKVYVVTLDVVAHEEFTKRNGVKLTPTLVMYHRGQIISSSVGLSAVAQTRLALDKVV